MRNQNNLPVYKATGWWKDRDILIPYDTVYKSFLSQHKGVPQSPLWRYWLNQSAGLDWDIAHTGYWLLIDEGQTTYFDSYFWSDFIKAIDESFKGYVIVVSSYSNRPGPTPHEFPFTLSQNPVFPCVTPIDVSEPQRISLQPRPWLRSLHTRPPTPGDQGLGLPPSRDEFQEVVDWWNANHNAFLLVAFSDELVDGIFSFTQGHVGIVRLLLSAFTGHYVIRKKINQRVTLGLHDFQEALFTTPTFHQSLIAGPSPQASCFPTVNSGDSKIPSL